MNYDKEALLWDSERRIARAKIISEEICKRIEIKSSYNALEFGCGTGLISFNLYQIFKEITLIDTSKGMIEILNSKIKNNNIKNMTALNLDIYNEHNLSEEYDVIYSSMVLHHIKDTERILQRLINLLKEDGFLCFIDLDEQNSDFHGDEIDFDGHNGFNQDELKGLMKKLGLSEVESFDFYSGKKEVNGKDVDYKLFIMVGKK